MHPAPSRRPRRLALALGAATAAVLATSSFGGPATATGDGRHATDSGSDALPPKVTSVVGTNTGALPDATNITGICGSNTGPGTREISFAVTGVTGPLSDVAVSVDLTHTFLGDISMTLIAPNGTTTSPVAVKPGATGATACGYGVNLAGVYQFNDQTTGNLWTTAAPLASTANLPIGIYRATGALSGTAITLSTPFLSLSDAVINGTWKLRVTDTGVGDTGTVNAATLKLTGKDYVPCQQATAKVTQAEASLAAANATLAADQAALAKAEKKLAKKKAKLKKLKQDGASQDKIDKAKAKVKKAKQARKAAKAKVAASQTAANSAQAALTAAQAEKAAVC